MYTNPQMAVVYDIGFTTLIFPSPSLPNYLIQWIRHAPKARPQIALVPREEACQPMRISGCCGNRTGVALAMEKSWGIRGKMHFLILCVGSPASVESIEILDRSFLNKKPVFIFFAIEHTVFVKNMLERLLI